MFYAYILESLQCPKQRYIGHTTDLRQRLADHNQGKCPHTKKFLPWKVKVYIAFEDLSTAQAFERYLKSGSGHAFSKRHFFLNKDEHHKRLMDSASKATCRSTDPLTADGERSQRT